MSRFHHRIRVALALAILAGGSSAQQFLHNTTDVPSSGGRTENVDFADIDNDGDWDAAFADGGDGGNDQNKIWLNMGLLQAGTVGVFTNVTSTRAPVVSDQSRDIEFVDFDNDGDFDIYVSNTSQITAQTNRWWTNMGGLQAGTIGFYQDETSSRWIGLGAPGSSIAVGLVNPSGPPGPSGGFSDWSCDCDFGDVDNDGDIDLVHSTYGGSFGGQVPTRIFLNDGSGHYSELNPSGFLLTGPTILTGNPGLWCEGTQQSNTVNATGLSCDLASTALDIDVADIDGDLDLDILHGARNELPRLFQNRLSETGVMIFRDVTGSSFAAGYSTGGGHYEQEMGDMDGDGDVDIYGLNWLSNLGLEDATLKNNGAGFFGNEATLASSSSDDNEGDFFDYDSDGDVDLFIANFSGQERVYRNDGAGNYTYMATGTVLPSDGTTSLDADCADVDNDGDYDVFVANDGGQAEWYLKNGTLSDDTFAPVLYRLEQAQSRVAGPAPTVVRVQVYDDAPYYITWYNPTHLELQVSGGPVQSFPMQSSQGQIFRGEIPGNLVGTITYRAVSSDKYNNTGVSPTLTYDSIGAPLGTAFCFGDGTQTLACPCGNNGAAGHGCANSVESSGALLVATGTTNPDTAVLSGSAMPLVVSAIYLKGDVNNPGVTFGDGVRCADGALIRLKTKQNVNGASQFPEAGDLSLSVRGATPPGSGLTGYYQVYYRNSAAAFCPPDTFNVSNGVFMTW